MQTVKINQKRKRLTAPRVYMTHGNTLWCHIRIARVKNE